MTTAAEVDPRRWHRAAFHGLEPLPPDDGRPLLGVWGNCQAESLRVLLGDGPDAAFRTVRLPPVFEITAEELPDLVRTASALDVLVVQPVRDDYRGLPIGTAQVRALLRSGARVVVVPSIHDQGLYPYQAMVHGPGVVEPSPVPYHDLRTLAEHLTGTRPTPLPVERIRTIAEASVAELARRERQHGAIPVSDLLRPAGIDAGHTVNHPGNTVLVGLARRIEEALGVGARATDPGRVLLRAVITPICEDVVQALDLGQGSRRPEWTIDGIEVTDENVRRAQLDWYRQHPEVSVAVAAIVKDRLAGLGVSA